MSKLVVVNYRVSEAQGRETRRKIALIRAVLKRCARLQKELAQLERVSGEDWAATLGVFQKRAQEDRWDDFVGDYNRLYDELPGVERQLETELSDTKAKRLRLELTASTLMGSCENPAQKKQLADILKGAPGYQGDEYRKALAEVETIVRERLATPLRVADPGLAADQIALARELLATMPQGAGSSALPAPRPAPATGSGATVHADRIRRLSEQLAEIDPALVSVDDLIARLMELPARDAAQRGLLIDSVEFEVKERLDAARRRIEAERTLEEALAWLEPFESVAAASHRERLMSASAAADPGAVRAAATAAKAWAEEEGRRQDGARVREVLLNELQALGYEVNVQGAAWEEGSRVTAQKPSEPNYDVQLSAAPNGAVQSKVRAYAHPGRGSGINRRDVEVEQNWCEDLARINKQLGERGILAEIALQEGPGTTAQIPLPSRRERPLDTGPARELERKA